jgi:phage-related protein (TIGR01555 family)
MRAARQDSSNSPLPAPRLSEKEVRDMRADGWANIYTALGTSKDKRLGLVVTPARRWDRQELLEAYRGGDVAATLIDLPADEMTREWIEFTADDDPENEVNAQVMDFLDGSNEGPEDAQGLRAREAMRDLIAWSRLFSGALILMGINDGRDPSQPVDYDNIKSIDFLNVVDSYSANARTYYSNLFAAKWGQVETYDLFNVMPGAASAGSRVVHESRVIRLDGVKLPAEDMIANQGWGDSILTRVWEVVRDYENVWMSFSYLLGDYAQTTIKLDGIRHALTSPDGKKLVAARMEAIEMCRSIARAVLLDTGEEFKRETVSLAGVPDAMQKFVERLAQAARMPIELLMGQPPGGINGNGETGRDYWHAQVAAMQNRLLKPALTKLLRVILAAKEGPTKGKVPEKWEVKFCSLTKMTDLQRADIRLKVSQADASDIDKQILDPEEVANSRYGSGRYSLDTKLDSKIRDKMAESLEQQRQPGPSPEEMIAAAAAKGEKKPAPEKDPGNGESA